MANTSAVVLPGVGAFDDCMNALQKQELLNGVREFIKTGKPFLGICVGYQALFEKSEEFNSCAAGLNIFQGKVRRFSEKPGLYRSPVMERSTRPPRHSRVCSSTMDTILTGRPSVVASNWKPTAHTAFGASATGTVPAVEARRRLRRRRCGTRRPSSRQSRWTFLWWTCQPSARASW